MMTTQELKAKYLEFFARKGHKIIPSASLIPENDPTVLFTTAGMHPLVPYLLGEKHPAGKRLTDVQKCFRTVDIDEVGDDVHLTFFEMLGNWSLGDYWKKEAISWSFEFLTKELGLPLDKLAVTCFVGDKDAPKDEESAAIWESLGLPKNRIYFFGKNDNWWGPAGQTGPCGPDTEMFYWTGTGPAPDLITGDNKSGWVEIWNDVFMQYNKTADGRFEPLAQKNVDTGMGVERTAAVLNGRDNVFEIENFKPIISQIRALAKTENQKAIRIIADHLRAATFILAEMLEPSNVEHGYVLRRLIRRAVRFGRQIGIKGIFCHQVAEAVIKEMAGDYPELKKNRDFIIEQLIREEEKFTETLEEGLKLAEKFFGKKIPIDPRKFRELMDNPNKADLIGRIFDKKLGGRDYSLKKPKLSKEEIVNATITGEESFLLFQSYGFPLEMIDELAMAKGLLISHKDFRQEQKKHQEISRAGAEQKFKGGLADTSEQTGRMHTSTHLLLAALRKVLGDHVLQKGSNITPKRIRFDFSHTQKMTPEQIKQVQDLVNEQIQKKIAVICEEMNLEEAKKRNAMGVFEYKYGEKVKVYSINDFSREICGGPHAKNTGELGHFKIIKEESSSAGVRRIKAVLE